MFEEIRQDWGKRIREARKARYGTQVEFCAVLGVTQATCSKWESGKRAPSDYWRCRIAGALGMQVFDLFPLEPIGEPVERGEQHCPVCHTVNGHVHRHLTSPADGKRGSR